MRKEKEKLIIILSKPNIASKGLVGPGSKKKKEEEEEEGLVGPLTTQISILILFLFFYTPEMFKLKNSLFNVLSKTKLI